MRTLFVLWLCLFGLKADVKVVEIGDETVIDGIKSKWIKILLPIETIKNNKNIYGTKLERQTGRTVGFSAVI